MEKNNFLTTNQIATRLGVQGATVRRGLCVQGHYMGIRPVKLPNNRLLWPETGLEKLLPQNSDSKCCPCKGEG